MIEMTNFKRGQCRDIESPRSQVFGQFFHITIFLLKTVTIFGPSTGRKLEQITPGILRNTPVTRNTVNLTPKTVTPPDSN